MSSHPHRQAPSTSAATTSPSTASRSAPSATAQPPVIDDLAGLYHQNDANLIRAGGVTKTAPPPPQPPRHFPLPSSPAVPPHEHPAQQQQQHQQQQQQQQQQQPPAPHPPRGSSLETRPYTYVRGHETDANYHVQQSWHNPNAAVRPASPVYSDSSEEEKYHTWRSDADLERAFPRQGYQAQAYSHSASLHPAGAPLVQYITNEWQERPRGRGMTRSRFVQRPQQYSTPQYEDSEFDDDDSLCGSCDNLCRSRACRRYACLFLILLVLLIYFWTHRWGPELGDMSRLKTSVRAAQAAEKGFFGINSRPLFHGLQQVAELERWKVPGSGARREPHQTRTGNRRLIFIGDIHGCIDELKALLNKVNFNPDLDHIVTTGDMIANGPSSLEVLQLLMTHNASCVRGGHEDRVLLAHRDYHGPSYRKAAAEGLTAVQPIKKGASSDLDLAASLTTEQTDFLARCPLILDVGNVPGIGRMAVAHAGLVPLVPFAVQDPFSVMSMRSIDLRNHVPSRDPPVGDRDVPPPNRSKLNGLRFQNPPTGRENHDRWGKTYVVSWPLLWDVAQRLSPSADRTTVVYGHDSPVGITQSEWSHGLDGGCVDGGELAALVLTSRVTGGTRREVVRVQCRAYSGGRAVLPALGAS